MASTAATTATAIYIFCTRLEYTSTCTQRPHSKSCSRGCSRHFSTATNPRPAPRPSDRPAALPVQAPPLAPLRAARAAQRRAVIDPKVPRRRGGGACTWTAGGPRSSLFRSSPPTVKKGKFFCQLYPPSGVSGDFSWHAFDSMFTGLLWRTRGAE